MNELMNWESDVPTNWNEIEVIGTSEDHQGVWVIFKDPNDPYFEKEKFSFAVQKEEIELVIKGEKWGVTDGSSLYYRMTKEEAQNILNKI